MKTLLVLCISLVATNPAQGTEKSLFPEISDSVSEVAEHVLKLVNDGQISFNGILLRVEYFEEPEIHFIQNRLGEQSLSVRLNMLCGLPSQYEDTEASYFHIRLDNRGNLENVLPALTSLGYQDPCVDLLVAPDLSGVWKADCDHNFGVQIDKVPNSEVYSLNFCGPGGCSNDGQWRPNSPILGDSAYEYEAGILTMNGDSASTRYSRCEQSHVETITNRSSRSLHSLGRR